jgi:hypothetical protein
MKKYAAPIMLLLGITAFSKNESGVFGLTAEQTTTLTEAGWNEGFVAKFNTALGLNFAEGTATSEDAPSLSAIDTQSLIDTSLALANAEMALEAATKNASTLASEKAALQANVTTLQGQVQTLSNKPEVDEGSGAQNAQGMGTTVTFNAMDDTQLGGLQGEMWALDRPYNQRARAAILASKGMQIAVPMASSTDFASLQADLGAYYRTQANKQINSMLLTLKNVSDIFPLQSNVVDREIITNIFMGEFSQADNSTDSDFDNVVKGVYQIESEEVRMYDVMLAHKFSNLKAIEKTWIGYLAKDSSSIKMSFVEYLLNETAKVLFNEQQQRRIRGVRKNPTVNVPGVAMAGSTGLYRFIHEKVNALQIKPTVLGEITQANIGEKVFNFIGSLPQQLIDSGMLALYMPQAMITEYHKYNETHYGLNQDYKANEMTVKEYPGVKLIPVPNAGNHRRLVCTFEGNLKTFENIPGEMTNFKLIIKEWSISVVSQWKEGFHAPLVGKKFSRVQDQDYDHQFIFVSDQDLSTNEYLPMDADATVPSALFHSSLVSVANTALKTITDIADVAVGAQVKLKNGSDTYGIAIAKSGNFSLIASAWSPSAGDTITLVKRADGKFIELSRSSAATTVLAFDADDATPSVTGGTEFVTNANTAATAITKFDNAVVGTTYIIHGAGSTNASTIANAGNFTLTAAMTLSTGKSITLICTATDTFAEISRV